MFSGWLRKKELIRKVHILTLPNIGKLGEKQEFSYFTSGIDITTWEGNLVISKEVQMLKPINQGQDV